MITRYSSRRQPLDTSFLRPRLHGAKGYDRIAGYFSSSILEVGGEALESVGGPVRVVCNSGLSRADVEVAKAAQAAMRREWCDSRPKALDGEARPRFQRLHDFLRTGKLEVRVVPDDVFGLVHGKAGVNTGGRTAHRLSRQRGSCCPRKTIGLTVSRGTLPVSLIVVRRLFLRRTYLVAPATNDALHILLP